MRPLRKYYIYLPNTGRLIVEARTKMEAVGIYEAMGHLVTCEVIKLVEKKKPR